MNCTLRLRPNFDIIEVGSKKVLFKSENLTLELEGNGIQELLRKAIPLFNGINTMDFIYERLSEYKKKDLDNLVQLLIGKQVLEKHRSGLDLDQVGASSPQMELIAEIGLSKNAVLKKLRNSHVAIVGLGAHGAQLASSLANEGIGHIKCLDPTTIRKEDVYLSNIFTKEDVGKSREEALARYVRSKYGSTLIETSGLKKITQKDIQRWIAKCDLAICCMDKGFSSVYYWLNKAALTQRLTWLVSNLEGHRATVGPVIVPMKSACFMCYKMRSVANQKSYSDAMICERFFDVQQDDKLYCRANLNMTAALVGNLLALEVFKQITNISQSSLVGRTLLIDFLSLKTEFHDILRKPLCPHCGQNSARKSNPDSIFNEKKRANLLELEQMLVSPTVGIIRSLKQVQKGSSEPPLPFVFTAAHSNFNYNKKFNEYFLTSSGKGMTTNEAKVSALGEAIERYCSTQYDATKFTFAKYSDLKEDAVNPIELVLYAADQYASKEFPYARFRENSQIMWTEGYSLLRKKRRMIPAISAYLDYYPASKHDYILAPTSNGLACGSNHAEAVMNGLLEVIERDAFLITWMCKLPMPLIDLESIKDDNIQIILRMYERSGIKVHVNALLLDTNVPTFLVTAIDSSDLERFAIVGLAAHPDPTVGILKALLEVGQVHPFLLRARRKSSYPRRISKLMNFSNVRNLEDHAILYTSSTFLHAFDFLLNNGESVDVKKLPQIKGRNVVEKLKSILSNLHSLDVDVIVKELTTPDISELGLSVFRVIITEFQPIHFGYNEARLGGRRLFELPKKLGFSSRFLEINDLNVFPHPLS